MPKYTVAFLLCLLLVIPVAVFADAERAGPPEGVKAAARPVFDVDGVVYVDAADDGFVEIGVANIGLRTAVEARLRQLGIPLSLVRIVETKPVFELATLRDEIRPLVGGLQIAFVKGGLVYVCTLGFNAVQNGVEGFLTNSHCTTSAFKQDGTIEYQPLPNKQVGQELKDPQPFSCGVARAKCRWSDAAFIRRFDGVTASLGIIAATTGVNDGSLTIAGGFQLVGGHDGNAQTGTVLRKVGRTTGQTEGTVDKTCADVRPSGSNVIRLCQDIVSAAVQIVAGGDSGSPVFRISDDPATPLVEVFLYGILWGGTSDGKSFVYSPLSNIITDLGPLQTTE
ncbi:MAG: hypothetical protein QXU44_07145 [Candidatus Caldarchaeum sp.]